MCLAVSFLFRFAVLQLRSVVFYVRGFRCNVIGGLILIRVYLEDTSTLYECYKMTCIEFENDVEHYDLCFRIYDSDSVLLVTVPKQTYARNILPRLLKDGYFHVGGIFRYVIE